MSSGSTIPQRIIKTLAKFLTYLGEVIPQRWYHKQPACCRSLGKRTYVDYPQALPRTVGDWFGFRRPHHFGLLELGVIERRRQQKLMDRPVGK
jgi:hypothetical protein